MAWSVTRSSRRCEIVLAGDLAVDLEDAREAVLG